MRKLFIYLFINLFILNNAIIIIIILLLLLLFLFLFSYCEKRLGILFFII